MADKNQGDEATRKDEETGAPAALDDLPASPQQVLSAEQRPPVPVVATGSFLVPDAGARLDTRLTALIGSGALSADSTGQLGEAAPAFGDVLLAIGTGVARSQEALDRGVVETARKLSETKIEYVSEVIQRLNDSGLPDPGATTLITTEASLLAFIRPSVLEWSRVGVCMDLAVGEVSEEVGVRFQQLQVSAGANVKAWRFSGWFAASASDTQVAAQSEEAWSQGQLRVDAELREREVDGTAALLEVTTGPQIHFAQGPPTRELDANGAETGRAVPLTLSVLKATGEVNASQAITIDSGPFTHSFAPGNGNKTDTRGRLVVTLRRDASGRGSRPVTAPVTARLGQLEQTTLVTL